jgi:hypothetical protein
MANRGWEDGGGGGEQVSSTARTTGGGTDCSDGDPFMRGSDLGAANTPDGTTMGDRGDLFEVRGQMST